MAGPFEIPWAPPDIRPGAQMLLGVLQRNRELDRADEFAKIQRDQIALGEKRLSAEEARRKAELEEHNKDRRAKAFLDSIALEKQGDHSTAATLRGQYGITETPEMTAPTLFTAAQALAGAPKTPTMTDTKHSFVGATPITAAQRAFAPRHETSVGTTVPEDDGPGLEEIAAPDVAASEIEQPSAERDLAPMTVDAEPTGAYSFTGPDGKPMGRFDPREQRDFRAARAGRVSEALGPVGQSIEAISALVASGDLDPKLAGPILANLRSETGAKAKVEDREDKQTFAAGESEKYRRTFEQSRELAQIGASGRVAAARAGTPFKNDTANRGDMGALRTAFKEWKGTVSLAVDSKSHKRLATAMANLNSGNAMQEREAAESLVAIFKGGGQVTKASQDLLLKHLAGLVGDAQTWLQHAATGNFGSMELNVLKTATENALKEEEEKLHLYQESARDTFGPGSGWEHLGGNVNHLIRGAFRQFGIDTPDIYEGSAPTIRIGSGERPKAAKSKPQRPAGALTGTMNGKRGYVDPATGKFVAEE